jgi:hypothetical protein
MNARDCNVQIIKRSLETAVWIINALVLVVQLNPHVLQMERRFVVVAIEDFK